MARPKNHSKHVGNAISDLMDAVKGLIRDTEERITRAMKKAAAGARRGGARKGKRRGSNPKQRAAIRKYWANLKGKARKERIRKMLAGRGLKPKSR